MNKKTARVLRKFAAERGLDTAQSRLFKRNYASLPAPDKPKALRFFSTGTFPKEEEDQVRILAVLNAGLDKAGYRKKVQAENVQRKRTRQEKAAKTLADARIKPL